MGSIPFARPLIGIGEEEAVLRVLRSGWLTTGSESLTFEKEFAAFLTPRGDAAGRSAAAPVMRALTVNSATSGLHLALEACGVGPGDIVFVPAYTFTASAEVARYLGAEVVFIDNVPGTFHLDPAALEQAIIKVNQGQGLKGRPRAVIPVHFGGLVRDMEAILDIARRYGLKVVEDAAHSFPSRLTVAGKSAYAGTLGDVGVFSFYATKTITTGEGGMVLSADEAMLERMSMMRLHGIDRSIWNRYTDNKASWYYQVQAPGCKYNMPDLLAAVGRVQLSRADEFLAMREKIARAYDAAFSGDPHFTCPPSGEGNAWHLYPLRLNLDTLSCTRNQFIEAMQEAGVGLSVHFIPLHTMPYYKDRYGLKETDFPEALKSFTREVSLPIWQGMEDWMLDKVSELAKTLAAKYSRVL
ncbi:DegT/DnrJ/EryC1/StrS family aminotransferase [Breznakiellaceae bacterium SP9]